MPVRIGLDVLVRSRFAGYRNRRAGLIANPASLDSSLVHAADRFGASGVLRLVALFGPQHGARADQQDNMIETGDEFDSRLGVPVFSLYSRHRKPTRRMLRGIDVMFCDLSDIGARPYTFLWTMALALEACAEAGIPFVVPDRPNPIGGEAVEGNLLDPSLRSFVGLYPVPMRHGFTAGEMAEWINREFRLGAEVEVIAVEGWRRDRYLDATGLSWVMPSPNMPTLDTAVVYPGTVLVEATNLSEGRGTTRPFELIGAPYIDANRFAGRLNGAALPGVRFRPAWFKPVFDKYQDQLCGGVQVHVRSRAEFLPYRTGLTVLAAALELYPDKFAWRRPPFEYERRKMPIDMLSGSRDIRRGLGRQVEPADLERRWLPELKRFLHIRARYLRY